MEKVVIAGSASLQNKIKKWLDYFEKQNYNCIDYPKSIPKEIFIKKYPKIHKNFFNNIRKSDILFIMNEDKKGISGYIGAETFAEMAFGVACILLDKQKLKIYLQQMPSKEVQSYDEVERWLKLGWIEIYNPNT